MSRLSSNYTIGRPTGLCAATGRRLEPGESCIACLCEPVEGDGFDRIDYSLDAWQGGARPERLFSFWQMTVPEPDAKPKVFVDDELLMNLFERLAEDERPQRIAFRFVLTLILMRKKLLRYQGRTGEGEGEKWLFRAKGSPPPPEVPLIEVMNPHLSEDDIRSITEQLGEILSGEFE